PTSTAPAAAAMRRVRAMRGPLVWCRAWWRLRWDAPRVRGVHRVGVPWRDSATVPPVIHRVPYRQPSRLARAYRPGMDTLAPLAILARALAGLPSRGHSGKPRHH